jgi:hypothetical protein
MAHPVIYSGNLEHTICWRGKLRRELRNVRSRSQPLNRQSPLIVRIPERFNQQGISHLTISDEIVPPSASEKLYLKERWCDGEIGEIKILDECK